MLYYVIREISKVKAKGIQSQWEEENLGKVVSYNLENRDLRRGIEGPGGFRG